MEIASNEVKKVTVEAQKKIDGAGTAARAGSNKF